MRMIDLKTELTEIEVVAPSVNTSTITSAAVDLQGYAGEAKVILDSALGTGTTPTLSGKIQDCDTSGGSYVDVAGYTFTQVTGAAGAGAQSIAVDIRLCRRYIKFVGTIAGTTPSFTCAVIAVAQKQAS